MPLVFEHGSDIGVRPVLVQPATLGVAAYANNLNKEVGNCFRGMSKARDVLRQAHMDVLVAVPRKQFSTSDATKFSGIGCSGTVEKG